MVKQFFILSLFTSFNLFSQSYIPLLDTYNEWQVTNCNFGCLTDAYYTDGDTIVDNKTYKILDGYHYLGRNFLLRENVDSKKVYLNITTDTKGDYLLYDFSMAVGDSIDIKNPITPFELNAGYYEVDSIISRMLYNGNNYKHFYLSPSSSNTTSSNNAIWIEGVGSLSIINAPGGLPDINAVGHLSCFFKDGNITYSNLDSISDCSSEYNLSNIRIQESLADVSLINPLDKNFVSLSNLPRFSKIEVFDFSGKRLMEIGNKNETLDISTSQFQQGMYFLKIYSPDDNKNKVFRFLVR